MEHWTAYWQATTSLNSFAEGEAATGYQGELAHFWQTQLADLPNDALIADLGTGNGALALLLAEQRLLQQKEWRILALDAAAIRPQAGLAQQPRYAELAATIRFYPQIAMEQLPFARKSMDLLVSQFALEYSKLELSLAEAVRVLKPGGRLVAIMHSHETALAKDSALALSVMTALNAGNGILDRIQQLLQLVTHLYAQQQLPEHNAGFIQANRQLLTQVKQYQQQLSVAELDWFQYLFAPFAALLFQPKAENNQQFLLLRQQLNYYRQRLADQQAACITPLRRQLIDQLMQQLGWQTSWQELRVERELFGLSLTSFAC
ncbi:class I SAM-dependent methyltransferase [Alishewanella sp. BS5-314]|uniref:class I SAM-dependent methyltransferase n=1 Tax=Alishewanella sp. BS5-314 TaxID=2755587 RepID=UPI0021BB4CE1|nr:class I SAM-dependent methyltransferase [Alishewanella sp. BS5-314]MCT8126793.1 class I SAM-dependent methyltransferase [Alishewanella sp. BS5-314]